ncbi:MAG: trypsin-like peptidase domain-containing protein, partial [Bacilli bacterium]|nr:trypsin-like peptidase domain-containing protein [Bacilli bacterium]
YEDLRDQLYDDIYADIYAELYADLSLGNMVSQALYDEIYAAVETKFAELLSEAELDLLVDDTQTKIYEVADLVKNSVVGISSYLDLEGKSLGSGVVYKHDTINDIYYVITNHHVVETGNNFKAVFFDASNVVATLIGYDSDVDIAVLTFSGADIDYDIQVSPLGNSADEMPGTIVLAAGNPQGYDFYGSVTMGVLSGVDRKVDSTVQRYLQHDASINSGNSGGPLYNLDGEVIGINVSKFAATDIEGLGFAIPIDVVKTVVATIESEN